VSTDEEALRMVRELAAAQKGSASDQR